MRKKMVIWGIVLTVCGVGYGWMGKYFVGNIFIITKPITGVVVDEETGKPLEGAYVECEWWGYRAGIGDSEEIKIGDRLTKTDKDGRFKIKRIFRLFPFVYYNTNPKKPLSCICKATAYTLGYRHSSPRKPIDPEYAKLLHKALGLNLTTTSIDGPELAMGKESVRIELKPLNDEEVFYEYLSMPDKIGDLTPCGEEEERASSCKIRYEFILNSHKRFLELYPMSNHAPDVHYSLAGYYACIKDYNTAIRELEKIIELYPKHPKAKGALDRIEEIKRRK